MRIGDEGLGLTGSWSQGSRGIRFRALSVEAGIRIRGLNNDPKHGESNPKANGKIGDSGPLGFRLIS